MENKRSFNPLYVGALESIMGTINPVEVVTPCDIASVKKGWLNALEHGFISPSFVYDKSKLARIAKHLGVLTMARHNFEESLVAESDFDALIKMIILNRIDEAIDTVEMAAAIANDDDRVTSALSRNKYGYPDCGSILDAYDIAEHSPCKIASAKLTKDEITCLKKITIPDESIKYWFTKVLELYGLEDKWLVVIDPNCAAIDVRDRNANGHPTIFIPQGREVDGQKLLELIGHEIECHVRNSMNCQELLKELMQTTKCRKELINLVSIMSKSDNEMLYEGVAKMSDIAISGGAPEPEPYYIIATDLASRGKNFAEVAEIICGLLMSANVDYETAQKKTWAVAYHIFRGSTNPSGHEGYCYTKDCYYRIGWTVCQNLNPQYLEFASLRLDEIDTIVDSGIELTPVYKNIDGVTYVKEHLL